MNEDARQVIENTLAPLGLDWNLYDDEERREAAGQVADDILGALLAEGWVVVKDDRESARE